MWHIFSSVSAISSKGSSSLSLEVVVGLHVVARHAEDRGAGLHEILVLVAELHGLGGAARRVVLGVEVHHHGLADVGGVGDLDAAGGIGFKFGEGFVDNDRHNFNLACRMCQGLDEAVTCVV
jgi:hypothetical protein